MKVICKKLYIHGGDEEHDPMKYDVLTIGKQYIVLTISITAVRGIRYCLIDNYNTAAYFSAKGFEVVSNKMPPNWGYSKNERGDVLMMPKRWMYDYFFENYEDWEPKAYELFYEEADIAYQLEGFGPAPQPHDSIN